MSTTIYLVAGLIVLVILTIIGVLSRYRKCRSDEVLIVYGKTSGKTSAKCYHGGSAFVWPIVQGYAVMSMKPMQIQCDLNGALSAQKIKVSVPTVVTVAISENPDIMQNAAVRLLGLKEDEKVDQIKDVIWGQMRLVVAEMTIEQLISDRDSFIGSCKTNIEKELEKFGLALININISDVTDEGEYIQNLGKEATAKAKYEALSLIEKREKEGAIGIAVQKKEKDIQLSEIERDRQISVNENEKTQAIKTAEIDKEKSTTTQTTLKEKDIQLRDIEREKNVQLAEKSKQETVAIREVQKQQSIENAQLEKDETVQIAEVTKQRAIEVATADAEQQQKTAEQERLRDTEVARQRNEKETEIAKTTAQKDQDVAAANAERDAQVAARQAESKAAQEKSKAEAEAKIVSAQQESEAAQITSQEQAESKKVKARQEKESDIAKYQSETRQKKAEADKLAKLTENKAGIDIAKSTGELGQAEATKDKVIGKAKAEAEMEIKVAQAKAEEEIAKAQRKAEEERLKSTTIVNTEIEAERKEKEALGYQKKVETEATADANAELIRAKAKAEAIRLQKLAEAEGELKLAEVKAANIAAETENIANLKRAGLGDGAIVSYYLKDQYVGIAEAQSSMLEKISLGNITVVGGSNEAGNFMLDIVKKLQEVSALKGVIPGLTGALGKLEKFDQESSEDQPKPETEGKE